MATRILVVDDESDLELLIQQKFRHQIKSGELAFDFALNGLEALAKIEQGTEYGMVLTDINMPEMDGLTLLSKIREAKRNFKTVVVSAYGDMGNIRTAMNRGAFDFITKPIDLKDLEVTIQKTLRETEQIRQGMAAKENLEKAIIEKDAALIEKEKAEEEKRFQHMFLANMSHEIRTPMNAVIGMTRLVLNTELNPQQLKYVQAIRISSENLLGIINDILDVSKIEAGRIEFEKIPFRLEEVYSNLHSVLNFKAEEKSLQLVLNAEPTPDLEGDPTRLNQVLINLVGNAIKFTERGSVTVNCRVLSNANNSVRLQFSVSDTGIGIPEDKIQSVFEIFNQAGKDITRKFGGTGLGLSICRQLIEMQGGTISAESKEGKGTTFTFEIEYGIAESMGAAKESVEEPGISRERLKQARILLVEDNEFNRIVAVDTITEFLGKANIGIAGHGQEAIDMLLKSEFDLVLMDIQMPVMDGFEATRHIRANFTSPLNRIPILAMTANATQEEIAKCLECGMDGHIPKPFDPEVLFRQMSRLLEANVNG
jgi:signal transduction histidine kinase